MVFFEHWILGYSAILGAILFLLLYLGIRQLRRFGAWTHREDPPQERKVIYVPFAIIIGFIVGGLIQPHINMGIDCYQTNNFNMKCILEKML